VKLVFTREAKRDLDELRAYLEPLSLDGLAHVVQSIELRVSAGLANPRIGRPTPREDVRELVESKYGFVIPYYLKGGTLYVLRVYNARRKPLDYDALTLP
jgi:toxin ParE1/3/4